MSIGSNQHLSMHSGLAIRQLVEAEQCGGCREAYVKLAALGNAIQESFYPDERIQKISALVTNPGIKQINRHHPYASDFLVAQSGLTHRQLTEAKRCEKCVGCFKRLVSREKEIFQNPIRERADRIAVLRTSHAIDLINQHHPFNTALIAKHTSLEDRHIESMENCPNAECDCKRVWAELKDHLETYEYGVPGKNLGHEIYILENKIKDPKELHGLISDLFLDE